MARAYSTTVEREDGIEFLEFHLSSSDPDAVIVIERYRTPEVHDLLHQTPQFHEMWKDVQRLCVEGRFENIFAERVEPDFERFGDHP